MSKQPDYKKEDVAAKLFEALEASVQINHVGLKQQVSALIRQHFPGLRRKVNEALNVPTGPAVNPEIEKKTWVHPLKKKQLAESAAVSPKAPAPAVEKVEQPAKPTKKEKDATSQNKTTGRRKSSGSPKRTRSTSRTKAK